MLREKAAAYGRSGKPVVWVDNRENALRVERVLAPYPNIRLLVVEE